jgi:hypothetical protein
LIGYLVLLKILENSKRNYDELDGSHKWRDIKQKQELIKMMQADLRDNLY